MLVGSHLRQLGMTRSTFLGSGLVTEVLAPWRQMPGRGKNRLIGDGMADRKAAVPVGYLAPHARLLPVVSGGLSLSSGGGTGTLAASGAMGLGAEATLAGSGDLTATGKLVVSAVATLAGSGDITDADCLAYLQMAATLAGSGDLTAAQSALGLAVAALSGAGDVTLQSYATGTLEAEVTPFTALSPESLASAVWSSEQGAFLYAVAHHRVVTDPAAGTYTVYDDDDVTPLYVADLWENAAGTVPYGGSGAERRDRFA